jgi:arylsulfatase A-like enzyme
MARSDMTRGEFLKTATLGGLTCALPSTLGAAPSGKPRRPNIVVILSDDHSYRTIGYNNPAVKTPRMDELARDGIIFEHAYVASPICAASRASLHTGLFPQQHGTIALDGEGFHRSVVEEKRYPTLAQLLAGAGYDTVFHGKSHLGPPRDYGFAVGEELTDPSDDTTFALAGQFLEERRGNEKPFLLWVAPRQPHIPLKPPQEWLDLYNPAEIPIDPNFLETPPSESIYNQGLPGEHYYRDSDAKGNYKNLPAGPPRSKDVVREFTRAYYAVVSRLDHQIGELVNRLKAAQLYDDTLVVYLSDNGYHLGNHGLGNKITMHEEAVCVPMFIHGPKLVKGGIRSESLVSSVDLMPTLLELAGVPRPGHLPGLSFRALLNNPRCSIHKYVASECVGVGGKPGQGHRMVRTRQWKYVLTDTNEEALFDEDADPYELKNIADLDANRTTRARLRGHMREWMSNIGDTHQPPGRV